MPPRNRLPQQKKKKKKPPRRQPLPMFGPANKPKQKRTRAAGAGAGMVQKYAQMIANPFTAYNIHGMFGEVATGISQFKKSYSFGIGTNGTAFNTSGYILWWPGGNASSYSTSENLTRDQPVGVMMLKTSSANGVPNTAAQKVFANEYTTWQQSVVATAATATTSVETPDNAFLSAIASKSKLLSAGMVLRCTSNPLILQGEYIKIDGLPMNQLLEPATATQCITVDRLFDLSAHEPRPFKAGHTVRHVYLNDRHNVGLATSCADEVTDNSDASTVNANAGNSKTCLAIIEKASSTATLPTAWDEAHCPKLFGIAFRGINPDMMPQIMVDCYVSKEYIVAPTNGIPNVVAGRSGPNLSEPAHLIATMKVNAFNAIENGVGEITKGLVGKGIKYGAEVLGLVA